jgi:TM2 domain-containing membrane protein YozV
MEVFAKLLSQPKNRKIAIAMALLATIIPLPIAGIHKFYVGQPLWGVIYLLLWNTPIPRIACAIDVVWYFVEGEENFDRRFNFQILTNSASKSVIVKAIEPQQVSGFAEALRELDRLRQDGLISEYEFEQKRRQFLDHIV